MKSKTDQAEDKYLNHSVKIKRIGYSALGKVVNLTDKGYTIIISEITDGTSYMKPGDAIIESKAGIRYSTTLITGSLA
jgi:hypothetical protein